MFGAIAASGSRSGTSSYLLPVFAALLLHAVIFWVFAGGLESWLPSPKPEPQVYKVVQASLVNIKPKAVPQKKAVKKVTPKPVSKPKPVVKKPATKKAVSKPDPKPEPVVQEQPEKIKKQDDSSLLDELFADEDAALEQAEELDEVQRYSALMKQLIEQSWSRPPSARRNMQVVLKIQLVPSGDVVSVNIDKSSGNVAFDRSAVLAVEKVGRFDFLTGMSSGVFEKYFRNFTFIFMPEDLRL